MLTFYFLNVGHGDSIIIEYKSPSGFVYGLIDSNNPANLSHPPALTKLQELGAKQLSFVVLTHPHMDHYNGLPAIIKFYKGKIGHFYCFPIGKYIPGRIKNLCSIYQKLHNSTESQTLKRQVTELLTVFLYVKKYIGPENWYEPNGYLNKIIPEGFGDVSIEVILPPAKIKGPYFEMIKKGTTDIVNSSRLNDLSLALKFTYKEREIVLGGDGTYVNWLDHERYCKQGPINIKGSVVKLPHHGSKHDCQPRVLDYLFDAGQKNKIAIISANGKSHPHKDVLNILSEKGISPYCTNLSRECGANIENLTTYRYKELTPKFNRLLRTIATHLEKKTQPCQGDIQVSINSSGELRIQPQFPILCPCRGGYDFLFDT